MCFYAQACFHEHIPYHFFDAYDSDDLVTKYQLDDDLESLKEMPFIALSLGENCAPALYLDHHHLRTRSFPFDWNIIPAGALYNLIRNHCDDWLSCKDLMIEGDIIKNTRYNFRFMHDFNTANWYNGPDGLAPKNQTAVDEYQKIATYYQRRIDRFYKIFDSMQVLSGLGSFEGDYYR